ncbi:hypothetical protein AG1IA_07159 [Rhizoctonia solani AG-1 IA]|uniref:Uncharacterized protein n=1 Tax=Thanatephorus cucumeris (strain AG1-IA) TaxID=983506 RepID=L8WKX4_THACA|nr:hypothetical protein AG1IA_07159 [Rhizoctonia solani AG-1 IA]
MAVDTYDALHSRSPFCVNTICMVAARYVRLHLLPPIVAHSVLQGSRWWSETYQKCRAEVEEISRHTLFTPVVRQEAVQAMVLVSGWSTNGWLPGGHAVRMGLEIGKCGDSHFCGVGKLGIKGYCLVKGCTRHGHVYTNVCARGRYWYRKRKDNLSFLPERGLSCSYSSISESACAFTCTFYVDEHPPVLPVVDRISFGTGRPAILRDDESIARCRDILRHPLSIQDDMRLVSMVELMVLRERLHNQLAPYEGPVEDRVYKVLHQAESDFRTWYEEWDHLFSQKYEDAAFYRQSLMIQRDFGELYHNATVLRGIRGPEDVARMPMEQKIVAQRAIRLAKRGLDNCIRSELKCIYSPQECDPNAIMSTVEDLVHLLSNSRSNSPTERWLVILMGSAVPAGRYARSLRLMLRSARRRRVLPPRPAGPVDRAGNPPLMFGASPQGTSYSDTSSPQQFTGASPGTHPDNSVSPAAFLMANGMMNPGQEFEPYLQGFELAPGQEVPVWLSESSLGDAALSQFGLEAFVIPQQYDPNSTETQIW